MRIQFKHELAQQRAQFQIELATQLALQKAFFENEIAILRTKPHSVWSVGHVLGYDLNHDQRVTIGGLARRVFKHINNDAEPQHSQADDSSRYAHDAVWILKASIERYMQTSPFDPPNKEKCSLDQWQQFAQDVSTIDNVYMCTYEYLCCRQDSTDVV